MIRSLARLLAVIVVGGLGASTQASPIQFAASVSGLPVIGSSSTPPFDLSQGGTISLGSPSLIGDQYTALWFTHNSIAIDTTVQVDIRTFLPPGASAVDSFSAEVLVPIHGAISGDGLTSDLQGGFAGTGVSAKSFYAPEVVLPQALVDLISHPERIHLSATVSGGHDNLLGTTLTIDPFPRPDPVPEPTVLGILVVGLGGAALRRRARRANIRA